jgi:hypothetical protein
MSSPIACKELFIFFILQCVQLVEVLVLEPVLVRPVLSSDQSLLNKRFWIFGFLWNDTMLTEDIVPELYKTIC